MDVQCGFPILVLEKVFSEICRIKGEGKCEVFQKREEFSLEEKKR